MRATRQSSLYAPRSLAWVPLLALLAATVPQAHGANADEYPNYDRGTDPEAPPPKDNPDLPAFPRAGDLARLDSEEIGSTYEYWIDTKSLTLDLEGVVRYTLVMRSAKGAPNIFYEGFRCDAQSYKTYAYGTRQGRFSQYPDPQWKHIKAESGKRPRAYLWLLYNRYFCSFDGQRHSLADIRRLLAGKPTPSNQGWRKVWDK